MRYRFAVFADPGQVPCWMSSQALASRRHLRPKSEDTDSTGVTGEDTGDREGRVSSEAKSQGPVHRYIELTPVGHCPHHEAPTATNAILSSWVTSLNEVGTSKSTVTGTGSFKFDATFAAGDRHDEVGVRAVEMDAGDVTPMAPLDWLLTEIVKK